VAEEIYQGESRLASSPQPILIWQVFTIKESEPFTSYSQSLVILRSIKALFEKRCQPRIYKYPFQMLVSI
jgi:hypothetical protein